MDSKSKRLDKLLNEAMLVIHAPSRKLQVLYPFRFKTNDEARAGRNALLKEIVFLIGKEIE